jgi:CPA2 family monovalent cation:H+ antiporter-2
VRSYDRIHSIALRNLNVDYELRETLESGLLFGRRTLEALGVSETSAYEIGEDIRRRDEQRLVLQVSEGLQAGRDMLFSQPVKPEPLVKPKRTMDFADPLAGTADAVVDGFRRATGTRRQRDVDTPNDWPRDVKPMKA